MRGFLCAALGLLLALLPCFQAAGEPVYLRVIARGDSRLAQAEKLCRVADDARAHGVPVVVDPILGDNGRRYNSVTTEQVEAMKRLIGHADVMTPNLTEACLMADVPCEHADWQKLMDRLSENGASVLITSAGDAVVGVDARTGMRFDIPFERVPGEHWGTGDRFCALLLDGLAHKMSFDRAAKRASDGVYEALKTENPANPIDKV